MVNNGTTGNPAEDERNKISPYRGFWSITPGGAQALYLDEMIGSFAPGKKDDFVVLDWKGGPLAQPWRQSLVVGKTGPSTIEQAADLLFGLMMMGTTARLMKPGWRGGARSRKCEF